MKTQSQQRLQSAVGIGTREVDEPPRTRREAGPDASPRCGGDLALRERRLEGGEERLLSAAPMDVDQDLLQGRQADPGDTGIPVDDTTATVMVSAASRPEPTSIQRLPARSTASPVTIAAPGLEGSG